MAATAVEKAFCVLELAKTNSVTVVQRRFRTKYGKSSPTRQSIYDWYKQFENTGCVCKRKSTGRPPVSEEQIDRVRDVYVRSPGKSTRSASLELQIPQPTVWKILRTVWKTSFLYKMELRLTGTHRSEIIWMNAFLDDGLAVQVRKTWCTSVGHLVVQT